MVTLHSNSALVSRYKQLLTADWTKAFPEQVLELLWKAVGASTGNGKGDPLLRLLDPSHNDIFQIDSFPAVVRRIAEGTKFVKVQGLPELQPDYQPPRKPSAGAVLATRLAAYLTLPALTTVTGSEDFFADVQALGFQAAVQVVLPTLRQRHVQEHALLLHAAVLFALGYSAYDAAHYAYMMSMIHGYLGQADARLDSLLAAFRLTSPEDHSYLTKAQEYWMELIDRNRFEDVENFLLALYRAALPDQQTEVRQMIDQAFKHILAADKHPR